MKHLGSIWGVLLAGWMCGMGVMPALAQETDVVALEKAVADLAKAVEPLTRMQPGFWSGS